MEVLLRLCAAVQSLVRLLTGPLFWLINLRPAPPCPPIKEPLVFMSATELARSIRTGQVTSRSVVQAYARRITEVNPVLNCIVEARIAAALEEADAVDQLVASGQKTLEQMENETPFLGVPFTVKESCSVKGMSYVVGSVGRKGRRAERDGGAVAYMKKAGAIVLAITTTPELCLSWETNNLVIGSTSNPYDTRRTSGGSSGGEAAIIGAAGSVIGLASDIAGSIRIPAMYNGIYGHKPTPGIIPITGHYPYVDEDPNFLKYLVIGPMARYAEDLRPMVKVLSGENAAKLRLDEKVDISKLRIYYMEDAGFSMAVLPVDKSIKKCIRHSAEALRKEHNAYVEKAKLKEFGQSLEISSAVFFGMDGIPDLLNNPYNPKQSLNLYVEILKSCFGLSKLAFSTLAFYFLRDVNCFIPKRKFQHYLAKNEALSKKLNLLLGDDAVLLYPTHPTPAGFHNEMYVKTSGVLYAMAINTLGLPSTQVPVGFNSQGLPLGFQVVAGPNQDRLSIAVAEELQRLMGGWTPPGACIM
ncbi:Hypothetical predicted protein [Cloeon dipterum]|uniref:Amidase domain-containing protein n=1 Tax=Cloeon dipterum TaxID=197152 RepID=A0A8S1CDN6_9INSE|nr:Hypothetical predicted protein [Cloeon dipterum]